MADSPFVSPFIPNTDEDRASMLATVGVSRIEDLFADIPAELRHPPLAIPAPLSEMELGAQMKALAERNFHAGAHPMFLGAGVYNHFCPAVVGPLVTRGEFLTSYTPYQPEVSQGTLQGSFEFQTMAAQLFGMEVSNAGMYDGASSFAEAALMACRVTKRSRVAIVDTVNPHYQEVVRAYVAAQNIEVYNIAPTATELEGNTACVLSQYPNFYGYIDDIAALADLAHAEGALSGVSCDPTALALFKAPGALGADIATGEGQALGVPMSFGGPYVGIFTCRTEYLRQMPGRIVGQTVDTEGRKAYVLTLQPREQHIRREHATSNICTSTALIGLWATIYTSLMGKRGLRHVAELCYQKAHYAAAEIAQIPGYDLPLQGTFFEEFVVRCPRPPDQISRALEDAGIIGGLDVSDRIDNGMLFCVTETNTRAQIDQLVTALRGIGQS
jgi:glycine dehydrogenase subunit 1